MPKRPRGGPDIYIYSPTKSCKIVHNYKELWFIRKGRLKEKGGDEIVDDVLGRQRIRST